MSLFRPEIEAMEAYALREEPARVKVNQNEAPWDWPPELKARAAHLVESVAFNRYPPFDENLLTHALARRLGLESESVLVGNGSNEILQALFLAALGPGRGVLVPSPSFSLYRQLAVVCGARVSDVPLKDSLSYDPSPWLEAVRREKPEVVLICSPNNPTGAVFPAEALPDLAGVSQGIVVVDEAYAEFAGPGSAALIGRHERLAVLRTFSKAWGGAALRLGYMLASPPFAAQVRKAMLPYNVSTVTAALGALALENADLFEGRVAAMESERERLSESLSGLPDLAVYPSRANFILVRLQGRSASEIHDELRRRGVLVRDVSRMPGLERCLRLSVGTPSENDAVVGALREVLT
jgi:histidinol-phosphate aminotransferase